MGLPLDENAYMQGLYVLKHVSRANGEEPDPPQTAALAQALVAPLLDQLFAGDHWARVTHESRISRVTIMKHGYRLAFTSERPSSVTITGLRLNGWRRGWPVTVYSGPFYEDDVRNAVSRALVDWYRRVGGADL
ncbi:hypothetical protein ACFFSY_03900 [Paenibacillus aurantiacus]|uniref:Uncharacterized protein n=1 Tax=Paenibacillus aurantiacus TaxID=1936118 RepID=A0ABV5KJK8_9BACL